MKLLKILFFISMCLR